MAISKYQNIAWTSITSVDNIAVANIASIDNIAAPAGGPLYRSTIYDFNTQTGQTNPASDWIPSAAYATDGWLNGQNCINGTQWTSGVSAKGMNSDTQATPSGTTGPNGGMTSVTNGAISTSTAQRYLYKECTSGYNAYDHVMRTPGYNFSTLMVNTANNLRMVFWYHAYGSNITPTIYRLWVDTLTTSNSAAATQIATLASSGNTMASGNDPYIKQEINLNAYRTINSTYYFYLQIPPMTGFRGDVAIDTVYFEEYI